MAPNIFYTLVHISSNPISKDIISVGIILFDGHRLYCRFSKSKIQLAKKLVDNPNVDINSLTKQIELKCSDINKESEKHSGMFKYSNRHFQSSLYEYLARYSNGLIQYSSPKTVIETSKTGKEIFEDLIKLLFKEKPTHYSVNKSIKPAYQYNKIVQKKLISRVEKKVHVNYHFSPKEFPSLHFKYDLDCIGKNGALIGAKSLDFRKNVQTLDLNLSHYYSLILLLGIKHNKPSENDFFLISEEPGIIKSKEHRLWESAETNPLVKVIHPEQSDIIAEIIESNNATTFLEATM
jgi:hypothetical protein